MRSGNDTAARARVARGLTVAPAIALAVLAAGCGSTTPGTATAARPTASLPLGTSVSATGATWAVLPMGVPRADNLFWQLFVLPAGGRQWKLATPPDVATNGAIAVSVTGAQSLAAGVRPSQLLRFSPVTSTANGGKTWLAGPPDPGLAQVPDALAAAPQGGQLLALDRTGRVEQGRTAWTTLTSLRRLAATSAARACAPAALTAVAYGPSGQPVVAASCTRRGVAGIFAEQGGHWSATGPTLPGAVSGQRIEVLRLVRTGSRLTALAQDLQRGGALRAESAHPDDVAIDPGFSRGCLPRVDVVAHSFHNTGRPPTASMSEGISAARSREAGHHAPSTKPVAFRPASGSAVEGGSVGNVLDADVMSGSGLRTEATRPGVSTRTTWALPPRCDMPPTSRTVHPAGPSASSPGPGRAVPRPVRTATARLPGCPEGGLC